MLAGIDDRYVIVNSGDEMSSFPKIKQLHPKLPRTAAIEMKLLSFFDRRANKVIVPAAINGRSKAHQGTGVLIVKFKISDW